MGTKIEQAVRDALRERVQQIEMADGTGLFLVGPVRMPINLDGDTVTFHWYSWLSAADGVSDFDHLLDKLPTMGLAEMQQSSVLVYGDFAAEEQAPIRMHSICHTGDIFGSKRCDCGFQLRQSMREIVEHGCGAVFYLANHEGRGIGLFSKALTYLLQEQGYDTVDANLQLGFADDSRSYKEAVSVLQALRSKPVTLMTNNPNKIRALEEEGVEQDHRSLWGDHSLYNTRYLKTKIRRAGHLMNAEAQRDFFEVEELTITRKR